MTHKDLIIKATIKHFANAQIYLDKPSGIGEHGNITQEFIAQVKKAADAQEGLDMVLDIFAEDYEDV